MDILSDKLILYFCKLCRQIASILHRKDGSVALGTSRKKTKQTDREIQLTMKREKFSSFKSIKKIIVSSSATMRWSIKFGLNTRVVVVVVDKLTNLHKKRRLMWFMRHLSTVFSSSLFLWRIFLSAGILQWVKQCLVRRQRNENILNHVLCINHQQTEGR